MGKRPIERIVILVLGLALSSCVSGYKKSVGEDVERIYTRIFYTDFETAWKSTLEALQRNSPIDISNKTARYVKTKWVDNTATRNFVDSFAAANAYLEARYRFEINLAPGFFNGKPSVKVAIQKEQVVKQDILDGWRKVKTDGIEEKTLLYRVGRLIVIDMKKVRLEEKKTQEALEEEFGNSGGEEIIYEDDEFDSEPI